MLDLLLIFVIVSASLGHGLCSALGGNGCGSSEVPGREVIACVATSVTGALCIWRRRPYSATLQLGLALLFGISAASQ
ncbi:hypothetical protein [Streptomyces sp. NRRL WC-3742]|uniref:hypothetical protein n=1 Tax=Streptomyces sp. NRRL WC-3742 TaxID=1463934 RepID=UPI00131BCF15|nr:hypothetical protein [Streptomyces sp. NRRL WC-3742]